MSHGDQVVKLPPGLQSAGFHGQLSLGRGRRTSPRKSTASSSIPRWSTRKKARKSWKTSCGRSAAARPPGTWRPTRKPRSSRSGGRWGRAGCFAGSPAGWIPRVAAVLIHRAIGSQLSCVFVNNGVLRLNEAEQVLAIFQKKLQIPPALRRRRGQNSLSPQGRGGARKKTKDHRPYLHPSFRAKGQGTNEGKGTFRFPGPGHALSQTSSRAFR